MFSKAAVLQSMFGLHAICRIRQEILQYCNRHSNFDTYTFFSHIQNYSSVFREVYKGKGIVWWNRVAKTNFILSERITNPFCFSYKRYQTSFCRMLTGRQVLKLCLPTYLIWRDSTFNMWHRHISKDCLQLFFTMLCDYRQTSVTYFTLC